MFEKAFGVSFLGFIEKEKDFFRNSFRNRFIRVFLSISRVLNVEEVNLTFQFRF